MIGYDFRRPYSTRLRAGQARACRLLLPMFDVPVIQAGASGAACITFEGRNSHRVDPQIGRRP